MLYDDYKKIYSKLSDPATQADALLELDANLSSDLAELDRLKAENTEFRNTNDKLRDTNAKLVLRITDATTDDTDDDDDFYADIENKFKEV